MELVGVFLLWGWGNTFLFVSSLLLILHRQIWRKSLILGEKCQSNNLDLLSVGKGEMYVPGHYERNQSCTIGRSRVETGKRGGNAASSVEEGSADVVHKKVSSVTTHEVTSSLLLPTTMQLVTVSTPTIIEELVLHNSTFVAEINNNDELLLARTIVPNMKSNNQLAQNLKCNAINSPAKVKIFLPPNPCNLEPINVEVDDTIMPENLGACCVFPSTDIGELIPINASDQLVRSNQFLAAATLKPILWVLQDARSAQASYVRLIPPKPPDRGSLAHQHTGWTPPINHMFKVNCDKAIFREEQKVGVGVIKRDEHGRVIASMAGSISLPFSVDAVEAFAAKEALKFDQKRGLLAIVLEGDSMRTIDSLLCEDVSLADIGHLIDEAKMSGIGVGIRESNRAVLVSFSQILKGDSLGLIQPLKLEERSLSPTGLLTKDAKMFANSFVRLLYSHIKRNNNEVTHSLAKNALCIPDFQVWMEDVPSHIVSILQLDVVEFH